MENKKITLNRDLVIYYEKKRMLFMDCVCNIKKILKNNDTTNKVQEIEQCINKCEMEYRELFDSHRDKFEDMFGVE